MAVSYHRVAPSFGRVGGSKASTRSSNFVKPSVFEMQSTPRAAHIASESMSGYIVNRMIGVSGISFFRTVAASAPFNRGIARSRSIKSGFRSEERRVGKEFMTQLRLNQY